MKILLKSSLISILLLNIGHIFGMGIFGVNYPQQVCDDAAWNGLSKEKKGSYAGQALAATRTKGSPKAHAEVVAALVKHVEKDPTTLNLVAHDPVESSIAFTQEELAQLAQEATSHNGTVEARTTALKNTLRQLNFLRHGEPARATERVTQAIGDRMVHTVTDSDLLAALKHLQATATSGDATILAAMIAEVTRRKMSTRTETSPLSPATISAAKSRIATALEQTQKKFNTLVNDFADTDRALREGFVGADVVLGTTPATPIALSPSDSDEDEMSPHAESAAMKEARRNLMHARVMFERYAQQTEEEVVSMQQEWREKRQARRREASTASAAPVAADPLGATGSSSTSTPAPSAAAPAAAPEPAAAIASAAVVTRAGDYPLSGGAAVRTLPVRPPAATYAAVATSVAQAPDAKQKQKDPKK